jgi:hypothetical protein
MVPLSLTLVTIWGDSQPYAAMDIPHKKHPLFVLEVGTGWALEPV